MFRDADSRNRSTGQVPQIQKQQPRLPYLGPDESSMQLQNAWLAYTYIVLVLARIGVKLV